MPLRMNMQSGRKHKSKLDVWENQRSGSLVAPLIFCYPLTKYFRFNRAKERLSKVSQAITERQAKQEKVGRFVSSLEKLEGPLTAFREDDWYSLVEYATVYSREDIRFAFKNGMEIKA